MPFDKTMRICSIDFIVVASLYVRSVLLFLCPQSTSLLVNISNQNKADARVKDSYLYRELYPIKSTRQP